ncbi:hypothetical protein ACEQ8H_004609 [Pleosporales sp. CAS-2024a]
MKAFVIGALLLQTLNAQTDGVDIATLDLPTGTEDVVLKPASADSAFGGDATTGPGFTFGRQTSSLGSTDASADPDCPPSCYAESSRIQRRQRVPSSSGGYAAFQWPGDDVKAAAAQDSACNDDMPAWLHKSSKAKRACHAVQAAQACPEKCYGSGAANAQAFDDLDDDTTTTDGTTEYDDTTTTDGTTDYDDTTTTDGTTEYDDTTTTDGTTDYEYTTTTDGTTDYDDITTTTDNWWDDTTTTDDTTDYEDTTTTDGTTDYDDTTTTDGYGDDTTTTDYWWDDTTTSSCTTLDGYGDDTTTHDGYGDETTTTDYWWDDTTTSSWSDDSTTLDGYGDETSTKGGYGDQTSSTRSLTDGYGNQTSSTRSLTSGYNYGTSIFTPTTLATSTKSADSGSYGGGSSSEVGYTGDTIASICPKQCNPTSGLNRCDVTTSCTGTGSGRTYCTCRAGYRSSQWNPKDFTKQFKFVGQPFVFVAPGEVCSELCSDQTCSEVIVRQQCS